MCTYQKIWAVSFALVVSLSLHAQRIVQSINEGWRYHQGQASLSLVDSLVDESSWQRIHLPHTWNEDAYLSKGYRQGVSWYRRSLNIPDEWQGLSLFLHIEGASKAVTLYVNGEEAGRHQGGYTAATFDVSHLLHPGQNKLAFCVDNNRDDIAPVSADFTFFGGLYRDVWLIATEPQHFKMTNMGSDGLFISTPFVSNEQGIVEVHGEVSNNSPTLCKAAIEVTLFDPDGEQVSQTRHPLTLKPNGDTDFQLQLPAVKRPKLWSPEHPHLYRVESRLVDLRRKRVMDNQTHHTGFRWFRFDADSGFYLNGQPYKLRGVCRHQDQKPIGPALTDEMHRRDMQLIKQMGANFIRISHYPQDPAVIEMCDRLGLLAWEEIPVIDVVPTTPGFDDHCEESLREMIRQHYNHPSIILWGYMNEILLVTQRLYGNKPEWPQAIERTLALAKRLEEVVRSEDPSRLSTMAFHGSNDYNTTGLSALTHVVGWNLYQGWYGGRLQEFEAFLKRQHVQWPTHPMLVSEYGAGSDRRLHTVSPKPFDFSIEYQQRYLEHYVPVLEETPYLCGGSYWNFIDFGSAKRDESMPRINNKGLVYADRTPKDVYHYLQAKWVTNRPILYLATRDWPVRTLVEDAKHPASIQVKVYSNLPTVELFADGNRIGEAPVENGHAIFSFTPQGGQTLLKTTGLWKGQRVEDAFLLTVQRLPLHTATHPLGTTELAVNVGSDCFFTSDQSQLTWVPDQPYTPGSWGYIGGTPYTTQSEIHGTADCPLFQTLRRDIEGYRFDLPMGRYEVELLFADPFASVEQSAYLLGRGGESQERAALFTIRCNGKPLMSRYAPSAMSGHLFAQRVKHIVQVHEQGIYLQFDAIQGSRLLNAIKIRALN